MLKTWLKWCDLISFRNLTRSSTVWMWLYRAFQVAGPACENARSTRRKWIIGGWFVWRKLDAYVSVLVEVVVGELEFVEGQRLFHPVRAAGRRVRVDVESPGHVRLGLAGRHPLRVVILVAAVVERDHVHQQDVLGARVQALQRHLERRKHPPASAYTKKTTNYSIGISAAIGVQNTENHLHP